MARVSLKETFLFGIGLTLVESLILFILSNIFTIFEPFQFPRFPEILFLVIFVSLFYFISKWILLKLNLIADSSRATIKESLLLAIVFEILSLALIFIFITIMKTQIDFINWDFINGSFFSIKSIIISILELAGIFYVTKWILVRLRLI